MEAVNHFKLPPQVFLSKMVQHASIDETLHEGGAVLREAEARQPVVTNPLVVHVTEGQVTPRRLWRRRARQRHHLLQLKAKYGLL